MRKILTLRHWQLVTIIVIPAILFSTTPLREIVGAICGLMFLLWVYSIGFFGHQQIRSIGLRPMNLKLFQANVLLLPVLMLLSSLPIFSGETFSTLDLVEMILGLYSAFAAFQAFICGEGFSRT